MADRRKPRAPRISDRAQQPVSPGPYASEVIFEPIGVCRNEIVPPLMIRDVQKRAVRSLYDGSGIDNDLRKAIECGIGAARGTL